MSRHFDVEDVDGISVVEFVGPKVAHEAGEQLYGLMEGEGHRRFVLDFRNVRFLSSNALGILVSFKRKADAAGGTLKLCCLDPDLLDLFRLTNLDRIFAICASRQQAVGGS